MKEEYVLVEVLNGSIIGVHSNIDNIKVGILDFDFDFDDILIEEPEVTHVDEDINSIANKIIKENKQMGLI